MKSTVAISSVEMVYENVRRGILDGTHAPGAPLRIQQLADEHGVSLIPVREAIRMLASDALVDVVRNRGARVAPLSLDDMVDIYRTRIVLEPEAIRQSAPRLTSAVIDAAERTLDAFISALEREDIDAYRIHRTFHFALYEPSQSRWLLRLITTLWDHTERYRRFSVPRSPLETVYTEHTAILAPLRLGDIESACVALRAHLENTVRFHASAQEGHPEIYRAEPGA